MAFGYKFTLKTTTSNLLSLKLQVLAQWQCNKISITLIVYYLKNLHKFKLEKYFQLKIINKILLILRKNLINLKITFLT